MHIDEIRIDGGTQSRAAISESTVTDYAEALTNGERFPPVVVYFDGLSNWLADGFHRVLAHRRAGVSEVAADVKDGTLRDAVLHAMGANASHGLRRTNADKRRAVLMALEHDEFKSWSDREIAKASGVSHTFVAEVRRDLNGRTKPLGGNGCHPEPVVSGNGCQPQVPESGNGCHPDTKTEPKRPGAKPVQAALQPQEPTHGPDDAEIAAAEAAQTAMVNELYRLADADDKLAEAFKTIERLTALVESQRMRINGLTNENGELIREVKRLRNKLVKVAA